MNRINPLYIGIALVIILFLLAIKLSSAKSELKDVQASYKETSKLSTKLTGLKDVYSKDRVKKSLQRILKLSTSAKIEEKTSTFGVIITSESMNKNEINALMGKLLNEAFNINLLKIKKLSDTTASLYVEIKW